MRKSLLYGNRLLLVFVFFESLFGQFFNGTAVNLTRSAPLFGLFLRGTELNLPLAPRLFAYYLELKYA